MTRPASVRFAFVAALLLAASVAGAVVTPPWDPFFAAQATVGDFGATTRPCAIAAGDFDADGKVDAVVGRTTGNVAFVKGNGNGTFAAPVVFTWKQAFFNAWAFAAGDVNGDGKLDVVWGASAVSTETTTAIAKVNDGDVRVFYGNGDGPFQVNGYLVSGV
ncbi:MAG: VCBS repeat-containing protein, partial [Acidobacteriota bacterium]